MVEALCSEDIPIVLVSTRKWPLFDPFSTRLPSLGSRFSFLLLVLSSSIPAPQRTHLFWIRNSLCFFLPVSTVIILPMSGPLCFYFLFSGESWLSYPSKSLFSISLRNVLKASSSWFYKDLQLLKAWTAPVTAILKVYLREPLRRQLSRWGWEPDLDPQNSWKSQKWWHVFVM